MISELVRVEQVLENHYKLALINQLKIMKMLDRL
jgi:hypothetical protein